MVEKTASAQTNEQWESLTAHPHSPSTVLWLAKGSILSKCSCQTQLLSASMEAERDVPQMKIDNLEWV